MTPVLSSVLVSSTAVAVVLCLAALCVVVVFRGVVTELVSVMLVALVPEVDELLGSGARLHVHGVLLVFDR